jgi:phage shock protein PspC (stress-responsive transcriptional regulator)
MNKTISITLAGQVFNIEEDAYPVLKEYLDSIKHAFAKQSYGAEVYTDIEDRVAELFKKKLSETKVEVVTLPDVQSVIKEMGTAADFGSEEAKIEKETFTASDKKLYRNTDDMIIAGVASGIAAYFGWEPALVRIVFGLTLIFGGWGIPLYILLWIVMPEAKTTGQKLEMRGSAVTIKKLEQTAKAKSEQIRNSGFFTSMIKGIGRIIRFVFKYLFAFIGTIIIIGATAAALFTTFLGAVAIFNRSSPYIDPVLNQAMPGSEYFLAIILSLVTILIPLMTLILAGLSLFRKKSIIKSSIGLVLLFVWISAAIGVGVIATRTAPKFEAAINTVYPETIRQLELSGFTKLDVDSDYEVHITPGTSYSVTLSGQEKYIDDAKIELDGQTLEVDRQGRAFFCIFCRSNRMRLDITMPAIEKIEASGATKIHAKGFNSNTLELDLSGASSADLEVNVKEFNAEISGASQITVSGSSDQLTARLSGASRLNADDFEARTGNLKTSGASKAFVNVLETLQIESSGASKVRYKGNPQTQIEDSGASEIENY